MSEQDSLLFETKHWKLELAREQTHVGRAVVRLKRQAADLAELTLEEQRDFFSVLQRYEWAIRQAFGAALFNWCCLMNHAFRHDPPTLWVHWHVRPRYKEKVEIGGEVFWDEAFGNHYDECAYREVPLLVRQEIIKKIQQHLPVEAFIHAQA